MNKKNIVFIILIIMLALLLGFIIGNLLTEYYPKINSKLSNYWKFLMKRW
jgi:uncharacterized protein YneF (UPF0154 family)